MALSSPDVCDPLDPLSQTYASQRMDSPRAEGIHVLGEVFWAWIGNRRSEDCLNVSGGVSEGGFTRSLSGKSRCWISSRGMGCTMLTDLVVLARLIVADKDEV